MHNLGTVFQFEVLRTLKKKSFWITALMFPVMIGVVVGIIFFAGQATDKAAQDAQKQQFSIAITDESRLLSPAALEAIHAKPYATKAEGIAAVKNGKVDAYFYYPSAIASQKIEVYGRDVGLFDNSRYEGVAKALLQQAATANVDKNVAAVLGNKVSASSQMYKDGVVYDGFGQMIAPGVFLILFYALIVMFGNQMLTSTTEEKENRVIEKILTTIEARTLIVGKILSLIVLGFIQMAVIIAPLIAGYIALRDRLALPQIDLSNIPLDPSRIVTAALIFIVSFLLFTGLLVAIGAAVPTAKEAGSFLGVVMVLIFGPLYAASLFVSAPDALLVKILSFFPFTAPIPLLLRNAVGNLSYSDAAIALAVLSVTTVVVMWIAVRLFRYGALEYTQRLSLKTLLKK